MDDELFYKIKDSLAKGKEIWIHLGSGKYAGSIARALDAKTNYDRDDYKDVEQSMHVPTAREEYEYYPEDADFKIKFKINERNIWINAWNLHESSQRYESIVIKSVDQEKKISKDFLDREFNIGDVVFLHSSTYGEILGVINEINNKGTLTIRTAKKQNKWYTSERSKQGIFLVPHARTNRILIIDDPAVLLLRA